MNHQNLWAITHGESTSLEEKTQKSWGKQPFSACLVPFLEETTSTLKA